MSRFSLGKHNISKAILIMLGLILWLYALRHQIQHGWFDRSDLLPFLGGCALIAAGFLPATTRINIIVFVAIMISLEVIAAVLLASRPQDKVVESNPEDIEKRASLGVRDENMGYKLVRNNRVFVRHTSDGKLIYEYTATTDFFGRRVTPQPANVKQDGFVAFFGGSFTFGAGVNDNETFPYFVGTQLTEYKIYNYGVNGYGTQHLLALMDDRDFREEIDAEYGIGVYVFISDHVRRATHTLRKTGSHISPHYVLDDEERVIRNGNFHTAHPVLYWLYRDVLSHSNLINLLRVDLPSIDNNDILRTCRLIDQARHRFAEQFRNSRFYVIFYPTHYQLLPQYEENLRACLEQSGIPYLDYLNEPWDEEYSIPYDGHPSARGHQHFANLIAPKLRLAMEQSWP